MSNEKQHPTTQAHKKHKSELVASGLSSSARKKLKSEVEVLAPSATEAAPTVAALDNCAGEATEPHSTSDLEVTIALDNDTQSLNENLPVNELTLNITTGMSKTDEQMHPTLCVGSGNEWLAKTFETLRKAPWAEVRACFQNVKVMRDYWTAEHVSPDGCGGGGIRLLVANTFQNTDEGAGLDEARMPSYLEARFHFDYFMQYYSMDDKQRQRQARITQSIMAPVAQQKGGFFLHTYIPEYSDFSKMYGKTGKNSIWNNLPIPTVEQYDGVAYLSPLCIVKYLFANGVPIDDMLLDFESTSSSQLDADNDGHNVIEHVYQNQKTVQWKEDLWHHAAETRLPKSTKAILLWACDWKDGFGPSKTKNNRGSVDAMTITLAPPKHLVNGIDNTFLVAVGLKRSKKGWETVAHKYRNDMRQLSTLDQPFYVYHGTLKKMIPVFFRRYASIEDKIERPDTTSTIGCGSDVHRCYGTIGIIKTPKCDKAGIEQFLMEESAGLKDSHWSWCDEFIDRSEGANGANLPSCRRCRRARLVHLGVLEAPKFNADDVDKLCEDCADWTQLDGENPQTMLQFPPPEGFPKFESENCPVDAPKGREPGLEHLQQIELTFELLIRATKYTFYHMSKVFTGPGSRKIKTWTQGNALTYLRTCGIAAGLGKEIINAGHNAYGLPVDYFEKENIGTFRFPAAWLGDLSVKEYIEAVMHLLNLGIADSLLDLTTSWLVQCKGTKEFDMSSTNFRRTIQPLLVDLKNFQLGWLRAYPFTGEGNKDKNKVFGTGSWQAENWMAFVRISPIIYGWICRDPVTGTKNGYSDVSRAMLSFHAVSARAMTHAGITPSLIDETEYLMREFLSCVRELDVRVRYDVLGGGPKTEAFWLKPNFMSLLNLVDMMISLGPLILWWDGGGKGEKFIQEIKPHIRRGVREDYNDFFRTLAQKIYKVRQIKYIEERLGLLVLANHELEDDEDEAKFSFGDMVDSIPYEDNDDDDDDDGISEIESSKTKVSLQGEVTQVEDDAMFKAKTIYIYRSESLLDECIAWRKPIAGLLQTVEKTDGSNEKAFEFLTVFRKPIKQFAHRVLKFDDSNGLQYHGMWYSPIALCLEHVQVTNHMHDVQHSAKMSAVAIPLHSILGPDHIDASKYCVITNWWKVRINNGHYVLPRLDASLYDNYDPEDLMSHVAVRNGNEYMEI
jgi:hypothetical protein